MFQFLHVTAHSGWTKYDRHESTSEKILQQPNMIWIKHCTSGDKGISWIICRWSSRKYILSKSNKDSFLGHAAFPWGNEQSYHADSPLPPSFQAKLFCRISNIRVSAVSQAAAVLLMVHWFIVPVKDELSLATVYTQGRKSQYSLTIMMIDYSSKPALKEARKHNQNHMWNILMGKTSWGKKIKIAKIIAKGRKK